VDWIVDYVSWVPASPVSELIGIMLADSQQNRSSSWKAQYRRAFDNNSKGAGIHRWKSGRWCYPTVGNTWAW